MNDALGYYQVLQITDEADADSIKRSYRDLAKVWHPDNNRGQDTTKIFQKISSAYETLSTPSKREIYDILSLVYDQNTYPDTDNLSPLTDVSSVSPVAINSAKVNSWIVSYTYHPQTLIIDYGNAAKELFRSSLNNWLLGWWHPKGFIANIKAIKNNYTNPISVQKTKQILIHNMIAYKIAGNNHASAQNGLNAIRYCSPDEQAKIRSFIDKLGVNISSPSKCSTVPLQLVQLITPILFLIIGFFLVGPKNNGTWRLFSDTQSINYYQQVNFGDNLHGTDDIVVGRVISIPIDKTDTSQLYHLTQEAKVMYGPSFDFDIIATLPYQTTVRLTGYTPDNKWARIMIDNGETGFVLLKHIAQGIGNIIPYGSAIID